MMSGPLEMKILLFFNYWFKEIFKYNGKANYHLQSDGYFENSLNGGIQKLS